MADEETGPRYIIKVADPIKTIELEVPLGFGEGQGWEDGASYHIEQSPRGFKLIRDERLV